MVILPHCKQSCRFESNMAGINDKSKTYSKSNSKNSAVTTINLLLYWYVQSKLINLPPSKSFACSSISWLMTSLYKLSYTLTIYQTMARNCGQRNGTCSGIHGNMAAIRSMETLYITEARNPIFCIPTRF